MLTYVISAFFATMGFGLLFHIRGSKLFFASLGGSIGGVVSYLCSMLGMHYFLVLLFTAIVFSMYAEVMSRVLKTPVTILIISEIICFVPGGLMYETMASFIRGDNEMALHFGIEALASAGALALGIMISSSLVKVYFYFVQKHIVTRRERIG